MNVEAQLMGLFATEREPYEWAGRGELMIKRCADCGRMTSADKYVCPHCSTSSLVGATASGRGTIHALTSIPSRGGEEPTVIVLVDLAEGPRLIGRLHTSRGAAAESASIGSTVSVAFESASEALAIPGWVLAKDEGVL